MTVKVQYYQLIIAKIVCYRFVHNYLGSKVHRSSTTSIVCGCNAPSVENFVETWMSFLPCRVAQSDHNFSHLRALSFLSQFLLVLFINIPAFHSPTMFTPQRFFECMLFIENVSDSITLNGNYSYSRGLFTYLLNVGIPSVQSSQHPTPNTHLSHLSFRVRLFCHRRHSPDAGNRLNLC